ncbi:MAG: hypothetical protein ACOYD9_02535 [Pyramidobacter sp.]|jgi:hypothetical protein
MRKITLALFCFLALACAACAAEGASKTSDAVDGVWGMDFGISCEEADRIMTDENGAILMCQYSYLPGYSESFYKVNFFGREGNLLLRFSKKGLFLARFAFIRTETLKSEVVADEDSRESAEDVVIDARTIGGAHRFTAAKKPEKMEFSANFNQLKAMLFSKYGTPSETLKNNGEVAGYRWKSGAFFRNGIVLYENRSLSRNDTVLTYEDTARR